VAVTVDQHDSDPFRSRKPYQGTLQVDIEPIRSGRRGVSEEIGALPPSLKAIAVGLADAEQVTRRVVHPGETIPVFDRVCSGLIGRLEPVVNPEPGNEGAFEPLSHTGEEHLDIDHPAGPVC
jgi:hypothetical protein